MVRFLTIGLLALVFFAGGLGASWWMAQQRLAAARASGHPPSGEAAVLAEVPGDPSKATKAAATHHTNHTETNLPTALRPDAALSPEDAFKFGEMFNKQKQRLEQERAQLARHRQRIEHVLKEIESSKRELEGLQV